MKGVHERRYQVIRVETLADREEFQDLKKELQHISQAYVKAELSCPETRGVAFAIPPPYEVFIAVVATVSGLATLADILLRHIRKPARGERRSATLRFNGREMVIKGNWSKDELEF